MSLGLLVLLGIVVGGLALRDKFWQRWQVDHGWCQRQIVHARPLLEALEEYRRRRGDYPGSLSELVPEFLSERPEPLVHPSGNGGERWYYMRPGGDGFQLSVTALHWVSSFDALVYRSSGEYPGVWGEENQTVEIGGWCYVVGAQNLRPAVVGVGRE